MTLFDARLNLYNEAEFQKASKQYKPVRRKKAEPVALSDEAATLEAADTVASEHFYTSQATAAEQPDRKVEAPSQGAPATPDIDLTDHAAPKQYTPYRVDQDTVADLEFEHTRATESELEHLAVSRSSAPVSPSPAGLGSSDEINEAKRREMASREHRALAIEPARQLNEAQMRQHEEYKARGRDSLKSQPIDIDLTDGADGAVTGKRDDYAFIPDDVLEKSPAIYRDNGRRGELKFDAKTPRFDTDMSDQRSVREPARAARSESRRHSGNDLDRHLRDANAPVRSSAKARESVQPATKTARAPEVQPSQVRPSQVRPMDRHLDIPPEPVAPAVEKETDRYTASSSSAQEMRRYQQHRPSVDVREYVEPPNTKQGSRLTPWLWFLGLIAAVCLAAFVARDLVANYLPESMAGSFCSITGCVPAEPKKDINLLEATRSSLSAHPQVDDALMISVDVVNNSVYKQPYPILAVQLLNAEGDSVAERSFNRGAYNVVGSSGSEFLMPGEPTRIQIELVDTGLGATDLKLEFE